MGLVTFFQILRPLLCLGGVGALAVGATGIWPLVVLAIAFETFNPMTWLPQRWWDLQMLGGGVLTAGAWLLSEGLL